MKELPLSLPLTPSGGGSSDRSGQSQPRPTQRPGVRMAMPRTPEVGSGLIRLFPGIGSFHGLAIKPLVHVTEIPVGRLKALVEWHQQRQRLLRLLVQLPCGSKELIEFLETGADKELIHRWDDSAALRSDEMNEANLRE